jgi:hypothetical protein
LDWSDPAERLNTRNVVESDGWYYNTRPMCLLLEHDLLTEVAAPAPPET